jgi:hypothetical protein
LIATSLFLIKHGHSTPDVFPIAMATHHSHRHDAYLAFATCALHSELHPPLPPSMTWTTTKRAGKPIHSYPVQWSLDLATRGSYLTFTSHITHTHTHTHTHTPRIAHTATSPPIFNAARLSYRGKCSLSPQKVPSNNRGRRVCHAARKRAPIYAPCRIPPALPPHLVPST